MIPLSTAIQPEIARLFGGWPEGWSIEDEGVEQCRVQTPEFAIAFFRDPRNNEVGSTLIYPESAGTIDTLQPHIIASYFQSLEWKPGPGIAYTELQPRVAIEVANLRALLEVMARERISPRELSFFQSGYNSAYTDYCAGKWSSET
ncbi:hypothetical protein [Sphingomonas sp.]|uniref:hypothetical protein n=1 Tax=Sphingomonas sp. TaxID=28214 RepID=UPI001B024D8D|nr:hypothetical protein [Sphingomonas sp.]MBO9713242.1 hypothetical protein [Sphingomonas sp.]